ncbi:MAG: hypothetical protein LBV49_07865, partial [Azonexus sp.]|nr:hypothetical protein [Azonexus sp.]
RQLIHGNLAKGIILGISSGRRRDFTPPPTRGQPVIQGRLTSTVKFLPIFPGRGSQRQNNLLESINMTNTLSLSQFIFGS